MHQFTINDSHSYDAREVADLLHKVYVHGKNKGRVESMIRTFRIFSAGFLSGAAGVLLYQVIA